MEEDLIGESKSLVGIYEIENRGLGFGEIGIGNHSEDYMLERLSVLDPGV